MALRRADRHPDRGFVLPDLLGGHLLITGDNLQQNLPLHVLVGSMLRHGQLPFWNQYIFSGTPLMADFNAGAFYPLMGLFVVLPDRAAWVATEVVLFSGIAVGMYVFLRALKLSTAACVLAAATYAFAGPVLEPGQPRGHDGGVRRHPVDAAGGPAHRP